MHPTDQRFSALHAAALKILSNPAHLVLPGVEGSCGVRVRRHSSSRVGFEGCLDLDKLQGSSSTLPEASEIRRLLHVGMARFSAPSREELVDLVEEQYSAHALLDAPLARMYNADSVAAWWSLQQAVLLSRKVTATPVGVTLRYSTCPNPSTPSSAELDLHLLQRWHFHRWAAPVAKALLGKPYLQLHATYTLSTDAAGKVTRQAETYDGAWGWGLWWPARLAAGLVVPLWSTLLLGY